MSKTSEQVKEVRLSQRDALEKTFFERFGANIIWVKPSRDNVETILEIWSFLSEIIAELEAYERAVETIKSVHNHVGSSVTPRYAKTLEALTTLDTQLKAI